MQINTVNVIEYVSDTLTQLAAFTDDASGNKLAVKCFTDIAEENGFSNEEIEQGLEDYKIFLFHSDVHGKL